MLANKLIEKIPDPCNAKKTLSIIYKKKTDEISKTIKSNYSSTENLWEPKHCWYKINYYRTSKSFFWWYKKKLNIFKQKNIKITKQEHAFKGFASTYNIKILNYFNNELSEIKSKLIELLTQLKGFKNIATLFLVFKGIETEDKTKHNNFYSSSKAEIIINKIDIYDVFKSIYITTIIQKFLGKSLGWIIGSVIDHTISISNYNPLAWIIYIKLPKNIDH